MTRVKICGITNISDAEYALGCGADALGLVFAKSPRRVNIKQAQKISRKLGPFVALVGVFANAPIAEVKRMVKECGLSAVQLHGDEKPSFCRKLKQAGIKVIKAFRVKQAVPYDKIKHYQVDAVMLDTFVDGKPGGTGRAFNWGLVKAIKPRLILSGGLTCGNVRQAIKQLHPYAVDVSSGVECRPGKKDRQKVKQFITRVKQGSGEHV